jgi:GTP-binding protein
LIEGAHEGHGLGIRFLRHLKRTRVMVYVLALDSDPARDFDIVRREAVAFDPDLALRPALIALNKADLISANDAKALAHAMHLRTGLEVAVISASEHRGLAPLAAAIAQKLKTFNTVRADVTGRL